MAKRYISGRDASGSVSTLPVWTSLDLQREIYTEDTKKRYYGTDEGWKEYGGGGGSSEADIYQDLLSSSIYLNCTWDGFDVEDRIDSGNSTMDFNATYSRYDFTAGEVLQSVDLFDSTLSSSLSAVGVSEALVFIDYTDTGTPSISATTDGINWDSLNNNEIHTFSNPGIVLKMRYEAGGTGYINSWAILYNSDSSGTVGTSRRKYITFYYEGLCEDETTIIDGFYFNDDITIDGVTITSRVAPSGSDMTIDLLKDGAELSNLATLTDGSDYEKTLINTTNYTSSERFGLKIKSVGSSESGQGLTIILHYYDR